MQAERCWKGSPTNPGIRIDDAAKRAVLVFDGHAVAASRFAKHGACAKCRRLPWRAWFSSVR